MQQLIRHRLCFSFKHRSTLRPNRHILSVLHLAYSPDTAGSGPARALPGTTLRCNKAPDATVGAISVSRTRNSLIPIRFIRPLAITYKLQFNFTKWLPARATLPPRSIAPKERVPVLPLYTVNCIARTAIKTSVGTISRIVRGPSNLFNFHFITGLRPIRPLRPFLFPSWGCESQPPMME